MLYTLCKRLVLILTFGSLGLFLAACQTEQASTQLVPVTRTLELPFPFVSWEQDPKELLLFNERDLTVMLYDTETEKRRELPILGMQKDSRLVRSTTQNQFAFSRDKTIYIYDMRENVEYPFVEGLMPAFSDDDNKLAFFAHNGEVLVVDRSQAEWTFEFLTGILWWQQPCCMEWQPNGDLLVFFLQNPGALRQIVAIDISTREQFNLVEGDLIGAASWSPDGKYFVFRDGIFDTLNAKIFDIEQRCVIAAIPLDHVVPVSWAPDGKHFVVKRNELAIQLIDIEATLQQPLDDYAATATCSE